MGAVDAVWEGLKVDDVDFADQRTLEHFLVSLYVFHRGSWQAEHCAASLCSTTWVVLDVALCSAPRTGTHDSDPAPCWNAVATGTTFVQRLLCATCSLSSTRSSAVSLGTSSTPFRSLRSVPSTKRTCSSPLHLNLRLCTPSTTLVTANGRC